MTRQEICDLMNRNPVFFLATLEGQQPRVRGMLLYRADENGIVFHTGTFKEVYAQIMQNPRVELCFNDFKQGIQLRVSGELELLDDKDLKDEISQHPSRKFLRDWKESGNLQEFYDQFAVFQLQPVQASVWTMDKNFTGKENIQM
ncbi:MAG TPA: pyridoxamine 5'-phosphate oxidase family protein [Syntrophomonadaceae bacterium]|nr:pyridoxamine 5'-phosphate oxidase family protein [Syntrophomonadaceae bacterium]